MKKIIYFLTLCTISATTISAQTPIIFRPGPGANDTNDQGGLNGGKDAWVYQGAPSTNYGDNTYINSLPISNCNNTHCESFIQFDLTTLPQYVDSVFVVFKHLAHTSYCYSGCDADFYFARVTQKWDEMNITYSNKPTYNYDTSFYGPINIKFPNDFNTRQYDITNAYKLWKSGTVPNFGMAIYSKTVTCNNAAVFFNATSSDDTSVSNRPYLKIYQHSVTNIDQLKNAKLEFQLFPNPANDILNLEYYLTTSQNVAINITDLTGKFIYKSNSYMSNGKNSAIIKTGYFVPGIYICNLISKDGKIACKFIKK